MIIKESTPPTIECPSDIEVVTTSAQGSAVKLENAVTHIESNKKNSVKSAINILNAFKNQVHDWIREGEISEEEGFDLIQEVDITIQVLQNG